MSNRRKTKITKSINIAVREILQGNIIALPTETVYGLAADATNEEAVLKIYETKRRPLFDPLIVHIRSIKEMKKYAEEIPAEVYKLAEKFSPGPITYILKKKKVIPDIVTAGLDTVAIRIPAHPMFQKILAKCKVPIAAPSANMFGRLSPTCAEDVYKELKGKLNYILDGGQCEFGIESTVISFIDDTIKILRPGFITKKEIQKVLKKKVILVRIKSRHSKNKLTIYSPGMMKTHYAPKTPLYITDNIYDFKEQSNVGLLDFSNYSSLNEVAINLFSDLRKLDEQGFAYIVASKVKDSGIGVAINDRLEKASKGRVKMGKWEIKFSIKK
ncbi:MAG: L-threonylcarbamoyladenylate synthase [Ignavibacteria bacterium]|nr:L-threonylcarbamoyladenylate synthase [Ignavibacteria bacterium]